MKLKTLEQHLAEHKRPIVGPTYNQNLIAFIRSHDSDAWENEFGTVTMELRFFNAPTQWAYVATFNEARIQLNY